MRKMVKSKNKNVKTQTAIERTGVKSLLEEIKRISSGRGTVIDPTKYRDIPNSVEMRNSIGFLSQEQMKRLTTAFSPSYINLMLSKDSKTGKGVIVTVIPETISYRNEIAKDLLDIHYGENIYDKLQFDDVISYLMHEAAMMPGAFSAAPKGITYLGANPQQIPEIGLVEVIHPRLIEATLGTENSPYAGLSIRINTNKKNVRELEKALNSFEYTPYKFHEYLKQQREWKKAV